MREFKPTVVMWATQAAVTHSAGHHIFTEAQEFAIRGPHDSWAEAQEFAITNAQKSLS